MIGEALLKTKHKTKQIERLKNRSDFLHAHRYGRKHVTDGFLIQCRRRRDGGPDGIAAEPDHTSPRIGFTASKKVGNSVARNRAKRRLRALAHEVLSQEQLAKAMSDYVLIARIETHDTPYAKLKKDLLRSLANLEKPQTKYVRKPKPNKKP